MPCSKCNGNNCPVHTSLLTRREVHLCIRCKVPRSRISASNSSTRCKIASPPLPLQLRRRSHPPNRSGASHTGTSWKYRATNAINQEETEYRSRETAYQAEGQVPTRDPPKQKQRYPHNMAKNNGNSGTGWKGQRFPQQYQGNTSLSSPSATCGSQEEPRFVQSSQNSRSVFRSSGILSNLAFHRGRV